jgi:hypothetical protein
VKVARIPDNVWIHDLHVLLRHRPPEYPLGAVVEVDHAAREAALVQQLELEA